MSDRLRRELGVGGATLLGLGSMLGTGVFVSLAVAAGITGPSVILSVAIAAGVAACNALSSAQLAAAHPVSGGTYEYGYTFLSPVLGFTAGWMFLVAKSASAATAALGVVGYALTATGVQVDSLRPYLPLLVVLILAGIVLAGIRRTSLVNGIIVSVTVAALLFLVARSIGSFRPDMFLGFFRPEVGRNAVPAFFYATALSFVAYTGYGRIATLGEEVRKPQKTIPRAIATTVVITFLLYVLVVSSGVAVLGSDGLSAAVATTGAPLEAAAMQTSGAAGRAFLSIGAITALLGVLLNLILGLSRVLLAMARRSDMPSVFARLNAQTTPAAAIVAVSALIAAITLVGDIRLTWSFSAFTVLVYYAIANLSALHIPPSKRLYPKWVSWLGLIGCVSLALFIDIAVLLTGLGVIALGLLWFTVARKLRKPT